ncbi:hypothetical protein BDZ91DRAFT_767964 [Kalaharituber pfeilii]|nr:hypothetical protein BDZ91DRAFT_767964 [Kalaharituber pfeilii]
MSNENRNATSTQSTTIINSNSTGTVTPTGTARRRHKQILKCTQCRLDKQRCTPIDRIWPSRCDRCIKYNHSCSPGLNAREERRRQAPSSFPLSFRTPPPQGELKRVTERLSPTPGGQYGTNTVPYMMRVPSPGTASSTGGSDDDQAEYYTDFENPTPQPSRYNQYSYLPVVMNPPQRPRSPISQVLSTRFTQFWTQYNPLSIVCPTSPRFVNAIHAIFSRHVPQYADTDDMVNHALMAFSAADASLSTRGERGKKLSIVGYKHAGRCQRMLSQRLEKLGIGFSGTSGNQTDIIIADTEIASVKLSIFLMICYGLMELSKSIPSYQVSDQPAPTISVSSNYKELPGGGYHVRLYVEKNGTEEEEPGLLFAHNTEVFAQFRKYYETNISPETTWDSLDNYNDKDDPEDDEEGVDRQGLSSRIESINPPSQRQLMKLRPEMLRLTTSLPFPTGQPVITPTSTTNTTPVIPVVDFSDLGAAAASVAVGEYSPPPGSYGITLPPRHTHPPQTLPHSHPSTSPDPSASPTSPKFDPIPEYPRTPLQMYIPAGTVASSYPTPGTVSPQMQRPPCSENENISGVQMHMQANMGI